MKSKSRFGIVSVLVVAILALLYVLPAFASDSTSTITGTGNRTVTVGVYAGPNVTTGSGVNTVTSGEVGASSALVVTEAMDTKVGSTIYVAAATNAYDVVLVKVVDTDTTTGNVNSGASNDTITVTVKNLTSGASINGTTLTSTTS